VWLVVAAVLLCAHTHAFKLHAASEVAANDKQGRLALCRYSLRVQRLFATRITPDDHWRFDRSRRLSDINARMPRPPTGGYQNAVLENAP